MPSRSRGISPATGGGSAGAMDRCGRGCRHLRAGSTGTCRRSQRPLSKALFLDLLQALKGRDSDWAAHAAQPWFSLSCPLLAVPTPCGVPPGPVLPPKFRVPNVLLLDLIIASRAADLLCSTNHHPHTGAPTGCPSPISPPLGLIGSRPPISISPFSMPLHDSPGPVSPMWSLTRYSLGVKQSCTSISAVKAAKSRSSLVRLRAKSLW